MFQNAAETVQTLYWSVAAQPDWQGQFSAAFMIDQLSGPSQKLGLWPMVLDRGKVPKKKVDKPSVSID